MRDSESTGVPDPIREAEDSRREQAVNWFLRLRSENVQSEDLEGLQSWVENDPRNALAYQEVSRTWQALGTYASTPEIVVDRRDALEDSRKAGQGRWSARSLADPRSPKVRLVRTTLWALVAGAALAAFGAFWIFSSHEGRLYSTDVGEQRKITLPDGSGVSLDAKTRMRVSYTDKERVIHLEQGQAAFVVAKDPLRPFRVDARNHTVVALGTEFNVEVVHDALLVTLIEGHLAVSEVPLLSQSAPAQTAHGSAYISGSQKPPGSRNVARDGSSLPQSRPPGIVEMNAGEELRIGRDGSAVLIATVDLSRAKAWQSGKIYFDNEPLESAAERINRYARRQIVVDRSVAQLGISGVFNTGDADSFAEAVTAYFPVRLDPADQSQLRLTSRD